MSEEELEEQIIQQIEVLVDELGGTMSHLERCNSMGRRSKVLEIEYNIERTYIMNIFVTDPDPVKSAEVLPDKHVVKMPLETCQMLAVVYSKWYFNWGNDLLPKKDGTPYNTEKGAFRGHPCTIWAAQNIYNTAWLIQHGFGLLEEYTHQIW